MGALWKTQICPVCVYLGVYTPMQIYMEVKGRLGCLPWSFSIFFSTGLLSAGWDNGICHSTQPSHYTRSSQCFEPSPPLTIG